MSNSTNTPSNIYVTKPDPLNNPDYSPLVTSNDPNAIKITNNFRSIYRNYVLFDSENDNNGNINNLDYASSQIQNSINDLITIITPCATSTDADKCISNICHYVTYVEQILSDYFIIFTDLTSSLRGIKSNFSFLQFFLIKKISDIVTNNKSNYDPGNKDYLLCTDGIYYYPKSDDPNMQKQYQKVIGGMEVQVTKRDTRQNNNGIIQFLLYILLPTVIFIILILLYVRHVQNSKILEQNEKNMQSSVSSTDSIPIITPYSNSHSEDKSKDKVGGTIFDILGFITNVGLKFF
jgi:hypothetical protein